MGERPGTSPEDGAGVVDGPLLTSVGASEEGMFAQVSGRLQFRSDCLLLGGTPVVWPEGTSWSRPILTIPGGDEVEVGQRVEGGGGYLDLDAVTRSFGEDVAREARRCLGGTGEIAVFNPGWEVRRVG
ncbi:hypothetical protein [Nocardioides sp. SYSU D00065]|uniref:hypothetical protein n=1 Tax=Nocardioides sp. SYSU D00065 TaxID=2817378 RepID=UPI001B31F5D9|nr:hypothetical protein [Nocardioides sp. SYSU D00065]